MILRDARVLVHIRNRKRHNQLRNCSLNNMHYWVATIVRTNYKVKIVIFRLIKCLKIDK